MNGWVVLAATVVLIVLSAFFVIIEFSLLGARRHRLEEAAVTSRGARGALRSVNELTIMLAGAQLGITACTFALGAVTKPAVDKLLGPLLESAGLPAVAADVTAFVLSLLLVTFLHLVVGEMAPKSWAIAHPETSAILTAPPARAFIWVFRPLLLWVNNIANRLVAATGVTPVDRAAVGGQDAATIRHLVEHSARVGALEESYHGPIASALAFETLRVDELVRDDVPPTSVPWDATVAELQQASARSGHLRVLVGADTDEPGLVHVRDTLLEPADRPVAGMARPVLTVPGDLHVHDALTRMRRASEQLVMVTDGPRTLGVVTLDDVLRNVVPGHEEAPDDASGRE